MPFLIAALFGITVQPVQAQEAVVIYSLQETIQKALKASIPLDISRLDITAAENLKKQRRADFLPAFSAGYQYTRRDEALLFGTQIYTPQDEYSLVASVTQPIFSGFARWHQYHIAQLNLQLAKIHKKLKRQDVVYNAQAVYFNFLKSKKLVEVAKESVATIEAHRDVAEQYFETGMVPRNDVLKAVVELANAQQYLVKAENALETIRSRFNIMVGNPLNSPVDVVDTQDYDTFTLDLDTCLQTAEKNRLEIAAADLEIQMAERYRKLSKKDYFPNVTLTGRYFRNGTEWDVNDGDGIIDPDGWDVTAAATWKLWEWGRTYYSQEEKNARLSQAKRRKADVLDRVQLDVTEAYLRVHEAEKNVETAKTAIAQAKENFRITQERYQEKMATSTDVLDDQTLLSRTMTQYYNALYVLKISQAALHRAMGQDQTE